MSRLKNLYRDLVDNRKHQWQRYRDVYKGFCDEVGEVRRRIQIGKANHASSTTAKRIKQPKKLWIAQTNE